MWKYTIWKCNVCEVQEKIDVHVGAKYSAPASYSKSAISMWKGAKVIQIV